eukprot:SAG22_NODE_5640_length_979_cov_0.912500_2_plen_158_part_01
MSSALLLLLPSPLLLLGGLVGCSAAPAAPWWQHGSAPSPLRVPADLAQHASPIWAAEVGHRSGPAPQFVMARTDFDVSSKGLTSAVAFVTGQQSPSAQPDARLATTALDGDYGASIPAGGSSQARLLGAYKLHINGIVVGGGPGRRANQTQGGDAIDI